MNRHLNNRERAPLPFVIREIRKALMAGQDEMGRFDANQRIIEILHKLGWHKREYIYALTRRERDALHTQIVISERINVFNRERQMICMRTGRLL